MNGPFEAPPAIERSVREILADRGGFSRLCHLKRPHRVADHCEKFIAYDAAGRSAAFVAVSPRTYPQVVRDATIRAHAARALLRGVAASAVLVPWRVEEADGLSYSVTEYAHPLDGHDLLSRWRRRTLARRSIDWLHSVTAQTVAVIPDIDLDSRIAGPLARLIADAGLPMPVRAAGRETLAALDGGRWRPRQQLAHNDFWWNNLVRPVSPGGDDWPYVIDWGSSSVSGFPVFDLLRMSESLRLSPRAFFKELRRKAQAIQESPAHATHYLLASLAHLGDNLGQWPREQYARASGEWFDYLRAGLAAGADSPRLQFRREPLAAKAADE